MTEATQTYQLPGRIDSSTLPAIVEALRERRGVGLDLDGSAVDRIGGQGLQLLISAMATWAQDGHRLRVVEPSAALLANTERLGFPIVPMDGAQGLT
jgi:anti-anti-sigma regulatory factor